MIRKSNTGLLFVWFLALSACVAVGGCGSDQPDFLRDPDRGSIADDASMPSTACSTPQDGCPCDPDGETVDCGKVVSRHGDYVSCSLGSRICGAGEWGPCIGRRSDHLSPGTNGQFASPGGLSLMSLGSGASCPTGFDPCDPFCHYIVDSPGGLDAGAGFIAGDGGLTEAPSPLRGCAELTIVPSSTTASVTSIAPVLAAPIALTATLSPRSCFPSPFRTTWTIDRFDYATIAGTSSENGSLSVLKPIVGDIVVTAYALGLSASTTIKITVKALDAPTATDANKPPSETQQTAFGTATTPCTGTPASTATWLYPYVGTYFALGLPAPVPQYRYGAANPTNPGAVKVSLRYPAGSTFETATFNYSLVLQEWNSVSISGGVAPNNLDPQVLLPQAAWSAFEQTARGNDADMLVQRLPCAGGTCGCPQVEKEKAITIHFVDGQLKGTIYYNSYNSGLGTTNTGAVLSIAPGARAPRLAVQPTVASGGNRCTTCHSINQDGTRLIANTLSFPTAGEYNQSNRYDITTAGPSPTVLDTYRAPGPGGNRFTFGGARTDGLLYMSHGGRATGTVGTGDPNWHSPNDYSALLSVTSPATPIAVGGWPANMLAVTPAFSPDGQELAFGFWGGNALPQSPAGTTLSSVGIGTRLAVVDFTCGKPPCTSSTASKYFSVSNARDLTPGVTERISYPSFTPAGDGVVYQRHYRTAVSKGNGATSRTPSGSTGPAVTITGTPNIQATGRVKIVTGGTRGIARFDWTYGASSGSAVTTATTAALGATGLTANFPGTSSYVLNDAYEWTWADFNGVLSTAWSPSHVNTIGGALAELWMSNVPRDKSIAATPTRLLALNGLDRSGASYLPQDSRTISAPAIAYHRDGNTFAITQADDCTITGSASVLDYRLNYLPSVNPVEVGGLVWVVFTSRRMYGNVATSDPWDAEPTQTACFSGIPPTKKLWIAAVDKHFTPGTDPSHPAFYLPGQELNAGNSNGYWVSAACIPVASSAPCSTSDDCCGGSGASPTARCSATTSTCSSITACKPVDASCTAGSDCCNGLVCGGDGKCTNALFYGTEQKYEREYIADCTASQRVAWRFFEWQATVPPGTSIGLGVQARGVATGAYAPSTPVFMSSITASTAARDWVHGPRTVGDLLKAASVPPSQPHLLVTMTFNPDPTRTAAPTLRRWRLLYDCLDDR